MKKRDNERTIELAALMVRLLGDKHNLSDADMNQACRDALAVQFAADGGDEDAHASAADASERLHSVWQTVHAARAAKTIN